ncbi:polysaccharide biosynthesis/export family protein [Shimia ponticola]|uniref:polysaccharide biosynthesis/export family protein n=1 Tax=Shimia ponticola TaxID=2582893 RepID=UPI00164C1800|nr:polysaccharide biosynthesis/export family protein [Shimia ponticola]
MRVLSKRGIGPVVALAAALVLSGCGAVYFSPKVSSGAQDGTKVRVLPLTAESALVANQSTYRPKELPAVFYATAGAGGTATRGAGAVPPPPTNLESRPTTLQRRLPPPVTPMAYEIGVGDVLVLATPSAGNTVEELSGLLAAQNRRQGYTVQDDGAIAIPDIGRVSVAGMTLDQAEAELFQRLVAAQVDPTFSLEVAEFNSKRVSIGGAVGAPGVTPITLTPLFLEEAIANAGGIRSSDIDFTSIRLYRNGTLYQIPVSDLYEGRAARIQLVDGDSIFVDTEYELSQAQAYFEEQIRISEFRQRARSQALAELQAEVDLRRSALNEARENYKSRVTFDAVDRDYVYLVGEVANPGRVTLPLGRQASLADVLFGEGGFENREANPGQIYVLRGSNDPREFAAMDAYQLDARNAVAFLVATRFEMRPNDIVLISEQPVTRWNRVVNQITPSLIGTGIRAASN